MVAHSIFQHFGVNLPTEYSKMLLDLLGATALDDGRAYELLKRERAGIEVGELSKLQQRYGLSDQNILSLLSINARTLQRRREIQPAQTKDDPRLTPTESATLLEVGRILVMASEIFGDDEKTQRWLKRPNPTLGGESPLMLMAFSTGRGLVRDVLGRIEHGIPA